MEPSHPGEYEQLRKQNIRRNNLFLKGIGLDTSQKKKEKSVVIAKKRRFVVPQTAKRRSYRQQMSQAEKNNKKIMCAEIVGKLL